MRPRAHGSAARLGRGRLVRGDWKSKNVSVMHGDLHTEPGIARSTAKYMSARTAPARLLAIRLGLSVIGRGKAVEHE